MATIGLNGNLNTNYQAHSGNNSAQNQDTKLNKTFENATNNMRNIMNVFNGLDQAKSDNAVSRIQGIAKMIATIMG